MDAITMDDTAVVDPDRCIGCGLCVPTCPGDAIVLRQKAAEHQYTPPDNTIKTYLMMARERAKI